MESTTTKDSAAAGTLTQFHYPTQCIGNKLPKKLKDVLPATFNHHVCSFEDFGNDTFSATLRLRIENDEEVKKWLQDFQSSSFVTWRVQKTFRLVEGLGGILKFKKEYRCQHNTRPDRNANKIKKRKTPSKNTNCPAKMTIRVRNIVTANGKVTRAKDKHLPEYPTLINLDYRHNHSVRSADALKHRDVAPETREQLISLFRMNHGAGAAHKILIANLQEKYGELYPTVAADRSICPDLQYCYRLHRRIYKTSNGKNKEKGSSVNVGNISIQHNEGIDVSDQTRVMSAQCSEGTPSHNKRRQMSALRSKGIPSPNKRVQMSAPCSEGIPPPNQERKMSSLCSKGIPPPNKERQMPALCSEGIPLPNKKVHMAAQCSKQIASSHDTDIPRSPKEPVMFYNSNRQLRTEFKNMSEELLTKFDDYPYTFRTMLTSMVMQYKKMVPGAYLSEDKTTAAVKKLSRVSTSLISIPPTGPDTPSKAVEEEYVELQWNPHNLMK